MKKVSLWLLGTALVAAPWAAAQSNTGDGAPVGSAPLTVAQISDEAWSQLQENLGAKRSETRVTALNALSLLGGNARAEQMVRTALGDDDIDVRLAAIVAAGQMDKDRQHPVFRTELHALMASDDPKLSFTAATSLWAEHDQSGETILIATAEGERSGGYSFWKESERNASATLHSPEALAKIAVQQGLVILVPPVGMGMGAYGYLKGTPGASPQVVAIEQLAKVHTPEVQKALITATKTKEAGARIAAAEALAKFSGQPVRDALYPLMMDEKEQVRLTAAAAYLRVSGGMAHRREP